jgi:ABC-2 type transport system permease protein
MGSLLFKMALRDFVRPRRIIGWIFVVVCVFAFAKIWKTVTPAMTARDAYAQISAVLVYRLLALSAAIFSTAVITQEIEQKTIVYLVTRPIPRWLLLFSRMAAAIVVVAGLSVLAAVAASLAVHGPRFLSNSLLPRDITGLVVGAVAYCSLFTLISLWFNRAMLICLLFAFGWEVAATMIPGDVGYLTIFEYLETISQRPALDGPGAVELLAGQQSLNLMSTNTAWTIISLMIVSFLALGAYWFTHFEYLPREDAE